MWEALKAKNYHRMIRSFTPHMNHWTSKFIPRITKGKEGTAAAAILCSARNGFREARCVSNHEFSHTD